jgi:hypothetical protein
MTIIQKIILTKFGYILNTKIKEYILLYSWNFHKNLAIWNKIMQNMANLGHFFHEKSFA